MIALISDTHENEPAIKRAVETIKARPHDFVVHLGDIISPPMLEHFKGLRMKIILGNNDGEVDGLSASARRLGFDEPVDELEFMHEGKKIYCYHGTDDRHLNNQIEYGGFDYVLCGHTHAKRDERVGVTRVVNPGALFRCTPYTIAFLDVVKDTLEFVEVKR